MLPEKFCCHLSESIGSELNLKTRGYLVAVSRTAPNSLRGSKLALDAGSGFNGCCEAARR